MMDVVLPGVDGPGAVKRFETVSLRTWMVVEKETLGDLRIAFQR
jgi:hypothetical protein